MTLRARWAGSPPRIGDYLMSAVRPRYAYRVREVIHRDRRVTWDPVTKAEQHRLELAVDRLAASDVPRDARVHAWKWDKRG